MTLKDSAKTYTLQRRFLMLQGPHGPFFRQLAARLRDSGAAVLRVGFNRGDEVFWRAPGYIAFRNGPEDWPEECARLLADHAITDVVLYGDARPIHAAAIAKARRAGLTVHVFEEGYIRPYWATYERGGSNGSSRLMRIPVAAMSAALAQSQVDVPRPPATWGDMREHIFYGALYHFLVLALNGGYRNFRPHRGVGVGAEFRMHLKRLLLMPLHRAQRRLATLRIRASGHPYHVALLQLEHDASFRAYSDFTRMAEFVELCLAGFAAGAPPHHHLVFKAHPLEDGRGAVGRAVETVARRLGVSNRVHLVRGGKLARLLDGAHSAVTVNSTAGQQVLWRGLPLRAFGRAVYCKPELVSSQDAAAFFAAPVAPKPRAYHDFRTFLLATSQVPGGFYSARGRRRLLQRVVAMMLDPQDPYDALLAGTAAPRQQFSPAV